jgi:UDP-galactopyranose mutase
MSVEDISVSAETLKNKSINESLDEKNDGKHLETESWPAKETEESRSDLVVWSHLRWDFVYQRPQHLLKRAAADWRVFFFEEPVFNGSMHLEVRERDAGVKVITPHLPEGLRSDVATQAVLKEMLERYFIENRIDECVFWYYTPMALEFTRQFAPLAIVYDCMDELSAFRGAPAHLLEREKELLKIADLVFTGGYSLYEAKRHRHPSVYAFPSSIDRAHFNQARTPKEDPADQREIPHPRLGFFGVIDERFDVQLIDEVSKARPEWQFVMIGPVVKIDPATLPQRANIHYLGGKDYNELPSYIGGWDVALLPFAQNESTRFISPTKTPEYLAAGKPVVSASIQDVVRPYGEMELVHIASNSNEFIAAIEKALTPEATNEEWRKRVDKFLAQTSWDDTWARMSALIDKATERKRIVPATLPMPDATAQQMRSANC